MKKTFFFFFSAPAGKLCPGSKFSEHLTQDELKTSQGLPSILLCCTKTKLSKTEFSDVKRRKKRPIVLQFQIQPPSDFAFKSSQNVMPGSRLSGWVALWGVHFGGQCPELGPRTMPHVSSAVALLEKQEWPSQGLPRPNCKSFVIKI